MTANLRSQIDRAVIMRARLFGTAVAVAAADLVAKAGAILALGDGRSVELPGPVDLRLLFNRGAAFGLGAALPTAIVVAVTGLLVAGVALYAWRAAPTLTRTGRVTLAVLLGGAVANFVDRGLDGVVTDYLHAGWWPTFNLADVAIVTGTGLFVLSLRRRAESHDGAKEST
jgi:signal peptidase II